MLLKNNLKLCIIGVCQAIVIAVIIIIKLGLLNYDLRVPFHYSGDSIIFLMYIKGLLQNGWTWTIPQLSAPFSMSAAAFPLMTNFDWGVMKVISIFTSEVGLILNLFWMLAVVFSAWSATFSLIQLRIPITLSFVGGLLYAFLPFALLRNVGHLNLVYYTVPFICLLSIDLARGSNADNTPLIRWVGMLGCIIQSFNYIYYSFFAIIILVFSGLLGYMRTGSRELAKFTAFAVIVVSFCSIINLLPGIYSWTKYGHPPDMNYKYVGESEIYGAKIRKMLMPHPDNIIPVFGIIGKKELRSNFPNDNENITARLGLYISTGFVFLLTVSLCLVKIPNMSNGHITLTVASLSLFTLLIITVGGFGAIINLITVPDVRSYNRFSVFIAFFALTGVSLWFADKFKLSKTLFSKSKWTVGIIILTLLSLYDQLLDCKGLVANQTMDAKSFYQERALVRELENIYPNKEKVFMLPATGFPPLSIHYHMVSYDHLRPYLWSNHLYWSWPSFSQKHRRWQTYISNLHGKEFVEALALSGFDLIWLDRFGYPDDAKNLIQDLVENGAKPVHIMDARYSIFDIQNVKRQLIEKMGDSLFENEAKVILEGGGIEVDWGEGFYSPEKNSKGVEFRWSRAISRVHFNNLHKDSRLITLSFVVQSGNNGLLLIRVGGNITSTPISSVSQQVQMRFTLGPLASTEVTFEAKVPSIKILGETRDLHFNVQAMKIIDKSISGIDWSNNAN